MATYFRAMYGALPAVAPPVIPIERERDKRAVKVLGGMKINNSHLKTIQIEDDLIDIPKIEYVHLLEAQIKEVRMKMRACEAKIIRLENNHSRVLSEISNIRRELVGKVNLRN